MTYATINISDYGGSVAANVLLCVFITAPVPLIFYFGLSYAVIRKWYHIYFGTTPMVFYCVVICIAIPLICYTNTHNLRNWWVLNDGTTFNGDISDLIADPNLGNNYQFFNLSGVYLFGGDLKNTPIGVNYYYCPSRYGNGGYRVFCTIALVQANFNTTSETNTPIFAGCQTSCSTNYVFGTTCDSIGARTTNFNDGSCFYYWYQWATFQQGSVLLSKKLSSDSPSYQFAAASTIVNNNGFPVIRIQDPQAYATEIVDLPKVQILKDQNYNYVITTNAIIFSITYFVWLLYGIGKIILFLYKDD